MMLTVLVAAGLALGLAAALPKLITPPAKPIRVVARRDPRYGMRPRD